MTEGTCAVQYFKLMDFAVSVSELAESVHDETYIQNVVKGCELNEAEDQTSPVTCVETSDLPRPGYRLDIGVPAPSPASGGRGGISVAGTGTGGEDRVKGGGGLVATKLSLEKATQTELEPREAKRHKTLLTMAKKVARFRWFQKQV